MAEQNIPSTTKADNVVALREPPTSTSAKSLQNQKLIAAGEAAVAKYRQSAAEMREQLLPMARGLAAARLEHPADQEFGKWLAGSKYAKLNKEIGLP